MEFTPKSERQIRDEMVLSPGVYEFEISKAEEKVSKSNNDMIELTLRVFAEDGGSRLLKDWLVPKMELKLNRFCRATGLEEVYNEGALTALVCEGVSGKVKLTVEGSLEYGDQNRVKDYVCEPLGEQAETPRETKSVDVVNQEFGDSYEAELAAKSDGIPF